ncbi:hypothetical protein STANM309S_05642 [Streptomyces tanashiensis]
MRPAFEDLLSAVRAGEVDVVVVNELSRLTRKGAHDALEIDSEFKKYGVRFVSVLEPFLDTSNAIGVAIFALIAALAKQGDIKAVRLRGAKDGIRAVGGRHSSSAPYGMRAVREEIGNLLVSVLEPDEDNPDHVAIVERMVEMSFAGISVHGAEQEQRRTGLLHVLQPQGARRAEHQAQGCRRLRRRTGVGTSRRRGHGRRQGQGMGGRGSTPLHDAAGSVRNPGRKARDGGAP